MTTAKKAPAKKAAPKRPAARQRKVEKPEVKSRKDVAPRVRIVITDGLQPDVVAISQALAEMAEEQPALDSPKLVQIIQQPGRMEPRWLAVLAH